MAKKKTFNFERLPCKIGVVNIGDDKVTTNLSIERQDLLPEDDDLNKLAELMCKARFTATIVCEPNQDGNPKGQETMKFATVTIKEAVFDTSGMSVQSSKVSTTISTPISEVDLTVLGKMAKKVCRITATRQGPAGDTVEQTEG